LKHCKNVDEVIEVATRYINKAYKIGRVRGRNIDKDLIRKCIFFIQKQSFDQMTLVNIANVFHFNPSYFSQFFKSNMGINFSDYVKILKISHAKKLLSETELKIYRIAHQLGFSSARYFSNLFKLETGITPSEWRRNAINQS
jgi:two-component system response regulator YesN